MMTGGGQNHGYVPSNHFVDTLPEQWENKEYLDSYSQLVSSNSSLVSHSHTALSIKKKQFSHTRLW